MSPGTDNLTGQNSLFTKEQIITYVFRFIALGLLIFSIMNFNSWRLIDPSASAEARVEKEDGLSRQQQTQLYQAQFDRTVEAKSGYAVQGFIFLALALLFYVISNKWPDWRDLYGEQMLYGYAFVIPPRWLDFISLCLPCARRPKQKNYSPKHRYYVLIVGCRRGRIYSGLFTARISAQKHLYPWPRDKFTGGGYFWFSHFAAVSAVCGHWVWVVLSLFAPEMYELLP